MTSPMEFLLTRRSRPAKMLSGPGPDTAQLRTILTAGVRVPDHGKLEPWRLIIVTGDGCLRVADAITRRAEALGEDADKASQAWRDVPVCVAIVGVPRESEKIPLSEQTLSVGCVGLSVLNAALASGWGANWLSGWASRDPEILLDVFGLSDDEWMAGFIHIGTCDVAVPERPRPDLDAITHWITE